MQPLSTDGTKERILEAARLAFAARGFSGASIRSIAEAAKVAKPMVFYYFTNKDSLCRAVVDDATSTLQRAYREALRTDGALDGLIALARAHCDLATTQPDLIRFLARCVVTDAELCSALREDQLAAIDEILDRALRLEISRTTARQLIRGAFSTYFMDTIAEAGPADSPESIAHALWRAIASSAILEENR